MGESKKMFRKKEPPKREHTPIDELFKKGAYGTASKMLENGETFVKEDSINSFLSTLPAVDLSKHHEGEMLSLTLDLIKFGAKVDYVSESGETPLLSAVSNRYPNRAILRGIVQLLVEDGRAEVTEETINLAKLNGDDKMADFLSFNCEAELLAEMLAKTTKVELPAEEEAPKKKAAPKKKTATTKKADTQKKTTAKKKPAAKKKD